MAQGDPLARDSAGRRSVCTLDDAEYSTRPATPVRVDLGVHVLFEPLGEFDLHHVLGADLGVTDAERAPRQHALDRRRERALGRYGIGQAA
jgi:hypothetical protein